MTADFSADIRNGGLPGLLEIVSPAVQPIAPAFRLLGDDPVERLLRWLDAQVIDQHAPEKVRRGCGFLILRRGFGSMDEAPCLGDNGGAKGLGGKIPWRQSLVAAGLRLAIRRRKQSDALFAASDEVAQHVIDLSMIGDFS